MTLILSVYEIDIHDMNNILCEEQPPKRKTKKYNNIFHRINQLLYKSFTYQSKKKKKTRFVEFITFDT